MQVDEAWAHDPAGRVEHHVANGGCQIFGDLGDATVVDRDIRAAFAALVEDGAASDDGARHHASPFRLEPEPSNVNSTAIRTATPLVT